MTTKKELRAEIERLQRACRLVRMTMNTQSNGGIGWMREFEALAFPEDFPPLHDGRYHPDGTLKPVEEWPGYISAARKIGEAGPDLEGFTYGGGRTQGKTYGKYPIESMRDGEPITEQYHYPLSSHSQGVDFSATAKPGKSPAELDLEAVFNELDTIVVQMTGEERRDPRDTVEQFAERTATHAALIVLSSLHSALEMGLSGVKQEDDRDDMLRKQRHANITG